MKRSGSTPGRLGTGVLILGILWPALLMAASPPAPSNSCIQCHRDLPDPTLSEPVALWAESVHAKVGNTCEGCHGGDPKNPTLKAMSPKFNFTPGPDAGAVTPFCGKCHMEIADFFKTSPHGLMGTPNCIQCHGSHTIQRVSETIISGQRCSGCHEEETPNQLRTLLKSPHQTLKDQEARLTRITLFPTAPLENDLAAAKKDFKSVRRVTHTFDLSRIQTESENLEKSLSRLAREIESLEASTRNRKFWGTLTLLLFAGLAGIIFLYLRHLRDSEAEKTRD